MKTLKTLLLALLVAFTATNISAQTKQVDAAKSTINWLGKAVTHQHVGTINIKSGALVFKKKKLAGGTFTVDMASLTATDVTGEKLTGLNGHLTSDDFFGTAKFPTATLVFKSLAAKPNGVYTVTADLTIKGITNPITFDLATTAKTATTSLKINRAKYDVRYGSGSFFDNLGDKTINDEFELNVALKF